MVTLRSDSPATPTGHRVDPGEATWQPSLFAGTAADETRDATRDALLRAPALCRGRPSRVLDAEPNHERRDLGRGAWVDHVPGWYPNGDALFDLILRIAPWHREGERMMYDRMTAVPRLTTGDWRDGRPLILDKMAMCLRSTYGTDLPSVSANLYRDGRDSVAWHGDRVGRNRAVTVVAILSLGSPRTLLLRPDGGGRSIGYTLHSGDLLVMGGTCQVTQEHCVPKRANAGPRVSVMFRERFGN